MSAASAGVRRAVLAVFWAWGFSLSELLVVLGLNRARLTGYWEVQSGVMWLLPTLWLAASAVGLLGAAFWALATHEKRRAQGLGALGWGVLIGGFAWGIGGGRHLENIALRAGFAALVGLTASLPVWWLAPRLSRAGEQGSRAFQVSLITCSLLLEVVNQLWLVRLYPTFHWCLSTVAYVLIVGVPFLRKLRVSERPTRAAEIAVPLVILGCVVALKPSAERLSHFDNFRLTLLEAAPSARYAVNLASLLAPPPALEVCPPNTDCAVHEVERTGDRTLDLRGRSLLLVSVDALRADHVGIYGYPRPTTPNIDELARTATVFDYAYCPTPHTSYSVTSLMTGKYMRPLLLQGSGGDSATWAEIFRTYGYKTAAFYPPAIFFIDGARFSGFQQKALGFEYRKEEFAEGAQRVGQVSDYLKRVDPKAPAFVWVHLFGPHEPYEDHAEHHFGERDLDRYDSEIADADATIGKLIQLVRTRDPNTIVVVTADHGEEFGEHGGRYHGTSVYEEQVRVPLIVQIPEHPRAPNSAKISAPVQTIDLLPTFLDLQRIPVAPRIRGRSFASMLSRPITPVTPVTPVEPGLALVETDEQTLLAEGTLRLICARSVGACALYDLKTDRAELHDISRSEAQRFGSMRSRLTSLAESHGTFEQQGLRAEGKGWPSPILRAMAGDGDVALDLAALLDDADSSIRVKAAEELFALRRAETAPALRLALRRDENENVKRWAAVALTRLGEGAPLTFDLLQDRDRQWRRVSALALAEDGNPAGQAELIAWWLDTESRDFERSRLILKALARIRSKDAVYALTRSLGDVRLRAEIARTLTAIGEKTAVGPLLSAFSEERYQNTRVALGEALVSLDAGPGMATPLIRFLGVPDPLPNGLWVGSQSRALEYIGGPTRRDMDRLRAQSQLGAAVRVTIPNGGNGHGVRVLVRARAREGEGWVKVSSGKNIFSYNSKGKLVSSRNLPTLDNKTAVELPVPRAPEFAQIQGSLNADSGAVPGQSTVFIVVAAAGVELDSIAFVPLSDELPPPAPRPWSAAGVPE